MTAVQFTWSRTAAINYLGILESDTTFLHPDCIQIILFYIKD